MRGQKVFFGGWPNLDFGNGSETDVARLRADIMPALGEITNSLREILALVKDNMSNISDLQDTIGALKATVDDLKQNQDKYDNAIQVIENRSASNEDDSELADAVAALKEQVEAVKAIDGHVQATVAAIPAATIATQTSGQTSTGVVTTTSGLQGQVVQAQTGAIGSNIPAGSVPTSATTPNATDAQQNPAPGTDTAGGIGAPTAGVSVGPTPS